MVYLQRQVDLSRRRLLVVRGRTLWSALEAGLAGGGQSVETAYEAGQIFFQPVICKRINDKLGTIRSVEVVHIPSKTFLII